MQQYKSVEGRIFDNKISKGLGEFCEYFGKGMYAGTVSVFRVPTLVRKCLNKQTLGQRKGSSSSAEDVGLVTGCTISALGSISLTSVFTSLSAVIDGNYIPLAVWGATNLASGIYELGRLGESREEYLELKGKVAF